VKIEDKIAARHLRHARLEAGADGTILKNGSSGAANLPFISPTIGRMPEKIKIISASSKTGEAQAISWR
jgi:hypothetical protein